MVDYNTIFGIDFYEKFTDYFSEVLDNFPQITSWSYLRYDKPLKKLPDFLVPVNSISKEYGYFYTNIYGAHTFSIKEFSKLSVTNLTNIFSIVRSDGASIYKRDIFTILQPLMKENYPFNIYKTNIEKDTGLKERGIEKFVENTYYFIYRFDIGEVDLKTKAFFVKLFILYNTINYINTVNSIYDYIYKLDLMNKFLKG